MAFGVFVAETFLLVLLVLTVNGVVLGMFLSDVRSELRTVGCPAGFHFLGFLLGEFRNLSYRSFLSFFGLLLRFFFVKLCAADDCIGFRFFGCFFVFSFNETGSERGNLIFVQINVIPDSLHVV